MKNAWGPLAAVCVLVIAVYAYMAQSGLLELLSPNAADAYYNSLVQGFRAGQLNLKKEVPPGLAQAADPYDPPASIPYWALPYRVLDLSYYKGRLYLYFGITPALILFWPFVALTGKYLFHRQAVAIFCTIGFLISVGLLRALWRRYFAEVSGWVVAACALALGLTTGLPALLSQADVYEVPISCGYMLTMLALAAVWKALHQPERSCRWLVAASVAYGLAVGSRPTLLFGAVILLVPVAQAWHEWRQLGARLIAAVGPIVLIGLGLMLYNVLRFDNPFEFGLHYQLAGERQVTRQFFNPHYLWFNFRVYFLEPAHWSARSPFVRATAMPSLPAGYAQVRRPFGVLTNIPLVWLALAVPLVWRNRSGPGASTLRWFAMAAALLFGICALTLGLFCGAALRYEVDFLPALLLLSAVGILGLERALAPTLASNRIRGQESGQACRPVWRLAARGGWGLLLGLSVVFNLLASVEYYAEAHNSLGSELFQAGKASEAVGQYQEALRIEPDYAEAHNKLGVALGRLGRQEEAIGHFEEALRIRPDDAEVHNNLGATLGQLGKAQEAIGHFEEALRIKPDYPEAHRNLGVALAQAGRAPEAVKHWQEALRLKPDYVEAHFNLAGALGQAGKIEDAIGHYEQALRIKPDYAEAHYNLGVVLEQAGRPRDAMQHYVWALRFRPDFADAQNALLKLQTRQ
jgi:tetratricopeptide (TPR) repeat protein